MKGDNARVAMGPADDLVNLFRAGPSVLATGASFRVGDAADSTCAAAEDAGTMRYSQAEAGLQVCNSEGGGQAAGGGRDFEVAWTANPEAGAAAGPGPWS